MADDNSSPRPKRRIKSADTFRDRAEKADIAASKPKKTSSVRRVIAKPFKVVFGPIVRTLRKTFIWKILAKIGRILKRILRFIVPPYLRSSWGELKLVTWPNWRQSRQLTFAVLVFAIVFGASIALVDFGLDHLFKRILLK